MPSTPNDPAWDEDGFVDDYEDEIEIVSLLDPRDDQGTIATDTRTAALQGNIHKRTNSTKRNPLTQLVGIVCLIAAVLLFATILLSRSSTLSDLQTPSVIANENIKGSDIISGSKTKSNNGEIYSTSSPTPTTPTSSSSSTATETAATTAAAETETKNTNTSHEPPSSNHSKVNDEKEDVFDWFQLHTGNTRIDRAYRLAMDELHQNIEHDEEVDDGSPHFVTDARGGRSWTRDTAYAIELATGLAHPHVSRRSLEFCTEQTNISTKETELRATVWYQNQCGEFGRWPNLSDAIVGARGAWHLYLYTGNSTMLEWAYETTLHTLLRAELEALQFKNEGDFADSLFGGASSSSTFAEASTDSGYCRQKRKSEWQPLGKTKALSTNILYYSGYRYAYRMGSILMENNLIVNTLKDRANRLKKTIRERLWIEEKGHYFALEDEDGNLADITEGLGLALAMLSDDFENEHRITMMFKKVNQTALGIPSLWHLGKEDHPGRIWPFISGFFAIAAAERGYPHIFAEGMARLIDLSEQGNTFAEFYELDKENSFESDRSRNLLSDAAYLGLIYRGLFGMKFQEGSIVFSPNKVEGTNGLLTMNETISLLNVKYRNAILDIYVTGFGTNVISFKLNGDVLELAEMDGWVTGRQVIEIEVGPSTS